MIAKIVKGGGFRGAVAYTCGKEGARQVGGNMAGEDPRQLAVEFGAVRGQNLACTKPVFHASLSLPEGEKLTDDQWRAAAETFLQKMGFDLSKNQFIVIRHADTRYDHVHIVANRVTLDEKFSVVSDSRDFRKSHQACREIEARFGLARVAAKASERQVALLATGGKADAMRRRIDEAVAKSGGDCDLFLGQLARHGIGIRENRQSTGRVAGHTFIDEARGAAFKGSELGRGFSHAGIEKRLGTIRQAAAKRSAVAVGKAVSGQIAGHLARAAGGVVPGLGGVLKAAKAAQKLTKAASPRSGKGRDNEHEL